MNRRGPLIRLAVVDDHPVFRLGLIRLFEREIDVSILWELDSLDQLDEMLEKYPVDVILIDPSSARTRTLWPPQGRSKRSTSRSR